MAALDWANFQGSGGVLYTCLVPLEGTTAVKPPGPKWFATSILLWKISVNYATRFRANITVHVAIKSGNHVQIEFENAQVPFRSEAGAGLGHVWLLFCGSV